MKFIYLYIHIHPSWLVSSVGSALHRYRRGHGFKSRTGLNFFQVLFSTTKLRVYDWRKYYKFTTLIILHGLLSTRDCTGVLLERANDINSQSFIRRTMFDLELEWTVGVGAGGRAKIFTPPHLRLFLFLTDDYPLSTYFLLSPVFRCHLIQRWRPQFSLRKYLAPAN